MDKIMAHSSSCISVNLFFVYYRGVRSFLPMSPMFTKKNDLYNLTSLSLVLLMLTLAAHWLLLVA